MYFRHRHGLVVLVKNQPLTSLRHILLLLISQQVLAQPVYRVGPGGSRSLAGYVAHYEDSTARLTIGQLAGKPFTVLKDKILNRGYTASHHWLRIRLQARTPQTVLLELNNPRLNACWFYQLTGGKLIRQVTTGDALPFQSRGFPSYNWVFPIPLAGPAPTDIYVMVAKRHEVLGVTTTLWESRAFEQHDRDRYLLWGVLTGFTLLILLINMVAFAATRQGVYGWFVGLILAVGFHISAQSGLGFQYLWPNRPGFNHLDPQLLSGWLIMLAQLQFMQQFIGQRAGLSRAFGVVQVFKRGLLVLLLLTVGLRLLDVFPEQHFRLTFNLTLLLTVVSVLLAFWSISERIRQRETVVLFYTVTFAVQMVGYLLVFLVNLAYAQGYEPFLRVDSYVVVVINLLFDLLVFTTGILFFSFQAYQRQNEQLLTTLHEQQQAQSGRVIEALEMERTRIAEDLYDDVGAMLSTAIGYVSGTLRKPEATQKFPLLVEARHLLGRAVDNLRTVSHNLMPKNFAELGLARSLAETISKVQATTNIRFEYVVAGAERRLPASTEVQIFRIAAELINDIVKNSNATQATFQLIYDHDHLRLMTEDNGPLPPQYNNLHAKVAFVNGTLDTDIGPDGVTVLIAIPYA
jgi:two-component system, sensor histidine kinase LadS